MSQSRHRVQAYGDQGWLVSCTPELVEQLRRAATAVPLVSEAIGAADSVLVVTVDLSTAMRERLEELTPSFSDDAAVGSVELRVRYDGEDLETVAGYCGLSIDDVVALHAAGSYVVAFTGFAPGFAYLRGLDVRLRVPRLATPRVSVPAGAVAIADAFAAVYPRSSPGGWRLVGRLADGEEPLWDSTRTDPARLTPGTRVRFVAVVK